MKGHIGAVLPAIEVGDVLKVRQTEVTTGWKVADAEEVKNTYRRGYVLAIYRTPLWRRETAGKDGQ